MSELKSELYSCGWENLKPSMRKLFLITMLNLNKPLELSAGIFGPMNLELFVMVGNYFLSKIKLVKIRMFSNLFR